MPVLKNNFQFIKWLLIFFICFTLGRYFSLTELGLSALEKYPKAWRYTLLCGVLSDFWIATLLSLLIFKIFRPVQNFLGLGLCFLILMHILYVENFHTLINPFHFIFLMTDSEFAKTSYQSLFDVRLVFSFGVVLISYGCLNYWQERKQLFIKPIFIFMIIFLAILSQVTKVQVMNQKSMGHLVPQQLGLNIVENLFLEFLNARKIYPLSENELKEASTLEKNYLRANNPVGVSLKKIITQNLKNNDPVYFYIFLLESEMPENSGFYTGVDDSFTPHLDDLARSGISFKNVYTTSNVTRGGQEASFCGLHTGVLNSVMRYLRNIDPICLPEVIRKNNFESKNYSSYSTFFHNGEFRYDQQGLFWRKQQTDRLVFYEDFNPYVPSTFWGVSDKELIKKVLLDLESEEQKIINLNMVLTVTNHHSWVIPADGTNLSYDQQNVRHESQLTALYVDDALNDFVQGIKNQKCINCQNKNDSIWDHSFLIFINDHGQQTPTIINPEGTFWSGSRENDVRSAKSLSSGLLILNGGIAKNALSDLHIENFSDDLLRSQLDIFATIADFLNVEVPTLGDSLFSDQSRWPVWVDFGDKIFFPEKDFEMVMSRNEFLNPETDHLYPEGVSRAKRIAREYEYLLMNDLIGK